MTADRRCDIHEGYCEGSALHIMGRDKMGCAQFRDGSWFTKDVCYGPHPGRNDGLGQADVTRSWLEASFAANRRAM